jgi:pimeloyl-ACP methyl ester carboxylesterase
VLLHGAMESGLSHMGLARSLADTFTVYLLERRGHRLGVPFVDGYCMQQEVDDVEALLTKTGATKVFGVSSGGLICLQAALTLPRVQKAAIYEPALIINGSASTALAAQYDEQIVDGNLAGALVTGMLAAQLGPPIFSIMPRGLLERLTRLAMWREEKQAKHGDVTMRMLAPTLHYDFALITEMTDTLDRYRGLRPDVLLLSGSRSPVWLKSAIGALARVVPHATPVEFRGLDHGGSSDVGTTNRGGNPERVAQELRRFFD